MPDRKAPLLVRFTDSDGIVWTVWDTTFARFKHHRHAHGDPEAKERVFVNGAGVKRRYRFKRGEARALDPEELERQLRLAGYLATEKLDPGPRGPR